MSNADKILEKMRNNPHDWRIESLKVVARSDGKTLPVPAKRPIKPIYIKKFVNFVME